MKGRDIPSSYFEGYYHVPTNERLLVDEQGHVIDLKLMACMLPAKGDHEYPVVNIFGQGSVHIHRLMALTFIPSDVDPDTLWVNHIDGDKSNYLPYNLEWTRPSDNMTHAYVFGLRTDCKAVICRDIRTKEVKRFHSTSECARYFKTTHSVISVYIKSRIPYPFNNHFELVFEGDNWRDISIENMVNVEPRNRSVVAVGDGTLHIFDTPEAASRYLEGVSVSSIYWQLNDHTDKPTEGFRFYYRDSYTDDLEYAIYLAGSFKESKPSKRPRPIKVTDTKGSHVTEWESVDRFSWTVGIKRNSIMKSMLKNEGMWGHYKIEYLDESLTN